MLGADPIDPGIFQLFSVSWLDADYSIPEPFTKIVEAVISVYTRQSGYKHWEFIIQHICNTHCSLSSEFRSQPYLHQTLVGAAHSAAVIGIERIFGRRWAILGDEDGFGADFFDVQMGIGHPSIYCTYVHLSSIL